jgi:hypothetical protein
MPRVHDKKLSIMALCALCALCGAGEPELRLAGDRRRRA